MLCRVGKGGIGGAGGKGGPGTSAHDAPVLLLDGAAGGAGGNGKHINRLIPFVQVIRTHLFETNLMKCIPMDRWTRW